MSSTMPPDGGNGPAWGHGDPSGQGSPEPLAAPSAYGHQGPIHGAPAPDQGGQPAPSFETWGYGGDQPPPTGRRGATGGLKALVLAVVLALVAGGGALAFYIADPLHLFRSGPQAAEAIPSDAVFYIGVDLDPSATQKVEALRFLTHFPGFKDASGVTDANTDVRRTIMDKLLDSEACSDLSFDADVKPWMGSKFAIAGMPPTEGSTEPIPIGVVEVTDSAAAKTGLDKLDKCGSESDSSFGLAFTGDYAVIAETQDQATQYADAASLASLADKPEFSADMDSLGDLGIVTSWVDVNTAIDLFGDEATTSSESSGLGFIRKNFQRAAATFRFQSDHAELATSIYGDVPQIDHGENQIVNLPDSTVLAMSEAGGGERLAKSWDDIEAAAAEGGLDIDTVMSDFENETGFTIPDDIETVLGDNVLMAVDGKGLSADVLTDGDTSKLNVGWRFSGDRDKLNDVYDRVRKFVEEGVGSGAVAVKKDTDDGFVLATNDEYADALAGRGTLGDSDAFTSVVDDGANKEFVLFFNFDQVEDQILDEAAKDGAPAEVIDNLRAVQAVALSSETVGHYTQGSLVVSVDD